MRGEFRVGPGFGGYVAREKWRRVCELGGVGEDCVGKFDVLLDDVGATVGDAFVEEKFAEPLALDCFADETWGASPTHGPGGANGTLHVDGNVVVRGGEFAAGGASFAKCRGRERCARPLLERDEMECVDEWLRLTKRGAGICGEQRRPCRLNGPGDVGLGVRGAQRGDGGHGMENVTHCAESHDE